MDITIDGRRIAYSLEGPEGAPVVAFVHGLAASRQSWSGAGERLRDRFRVLTYDLRSHGGSAVSTDAVTRKELAGDLVALLDALEIPQVAVVGHSAGGVIAMHTALDFRKRTWALGLVGTASECNEKTVAWYGDCIEIGRTKGGEAVMKTMGMKPGAGPVPDGKGIGPILTAMRSLGVDPPTERLRSLDLPTFIIVGEKDFLGVGGSVILSRVIAGSELHIVPDRRHGIHLEDPDGFTEKLGAFLDGVVSSNAAA